MLELMNVLEIMRGSSNSTQIKPLHQHSARFFQKLALSCFILWSVEQRAHFFAVRLWEGVRGRGKETRGAVSRVGWSPSCCVWLRRPLWPAPQTDLVLKSAREPRICMLFVFKIQFQVCGMKWMNEQYSDSWLRGVLRNPDHTEDPITGSAWIRRHRHRQRQNKQSKRQRETVLERQTPSSLFYQGVSSQSKKAKSRNFILNKSPFKILGVTRRLAVEATSSLSAPLPLHRHIQLHNGPCG